MLLGEHLSKNKSKVKRVLPKWLANPDIVPCDYDSLLNINELGCLDEQTLSALQDHKITHFFPVQSQVIPRLISNLGHNFFPPNDICVSAPTGSGKTLAYVLPILQNLKQRVVPSVRALIVLPVQDLAVQVYKVFQTFNKGTDLRIKLLSASKSFTQEQRELVREGVEGLHVLVDILVATPGRLVDHLQKTEGFSLKNLRFLVIDEADRVMQNVQNDWLSHVENSVYSQGRKRMGPFNVANASKVQTPLQKLLFSATLSQHPEQLQDLNLFEPKLFTSVSKPDDDLVKIIADEEDSLEKTEDGFVGQFTTPKELSEYFTLCLSEKKIQVLEYLIRSKNMQKVIIFANAIYRVHNLTAHLNEYGIKTAEFSSKVIKVIFWSYSHIHGYIKS